LSRLPTADRRLDLLVISHIDDDHIGSILPLIERSDAELPGLSIDDVWFNGLPQLPESEVRRGRSVSQGEDLVNLLGGNRQAERCPGTARSPEPR
jgi:flavorubredoxin